MKLSEDRQDEQTQNTKKHKTLPKEENLHYSKYLKYETYKRKVTPQRMAQGYEKYSILSNNKITTKSAPEGGKETNTKWSKLKHKF